MYLLFTDIKPVNVRVNKVIVKVIVIFIPTKEHENDKKSQHEEINFIFSRISFKVNQRRDIQDIPVAELEFTYGFRFQLLLLFLSLRWLKDMTVFLFSWQTQYLTSERSELIFYLNFLVVDTRSVETANC